ncbi:MAG: LysR substrate-binding domain-containing protein, partial [Roseovarius confluentis]
DLAIVHGPVGNATPQHFTLTHIMEDETLLAVRGDHPLAKRKSLTTKDLNGLSIVYQGPVSATHAIIQNLARRTGIEFESQFEVASVEAIKESILQGFGAGFLSRMSVQREVAAGSLVALSIKDGHLQRPIMVIHPQENQISPRIHAFLDVLDETRRAARSRPKA